MNFEFALVALSTIGTAIWTVLTWTEQEEKERRIEQDQLDALCINPFMLATQELNFVLYRILVQDQLGVFRREISHEGEPEGEITYHEALAIVYVIMKYFGWVFVFYHYGSYVQDRKAIELTRNIAETFADRETFGSDVFLFTLTQQRSLGYAIVKKFPSHDPTYPEFTELSVYEFEEIMSGYKPEDFFYQDVMKVVDGIRKANSIKDLSGWERLIVVQNQLVDLLSYIESEEGYSFTTKKRQKTLLLNDAIIDQENGLTADLHSPAVSFLPNFLPLPNLGGLNFWGETGGDNKNNPEIVHHIGGRIRVKVPMVFNNSNYAQNIQSLIENITGVESVRINQPASSVTVYYNERIAEKEFAKLLLERIQIAV
ncbi:MAG: hypothetical protein N5P05_001359 [Chroococcopsis gigantea SAG 12.99]|jgi:hypothetical protein|nr:heavy-metal-associated domain-containing protein [Chlorogloea purpurea SAG 13.99]MDV2999753.1 hypothetical protein [Chroococcopsis gigantea SAG 12.99]